MYLNCDSSTGGSGCSVSSPNPNSYGTGFNNNGGGVYAMEWTWNHIQIWFFPRGSVPADITAGTPVPGPAWGTPQSNFWNGLGCDIETHFADMNIVFDITFCGDWAYNVWGNDPVCAALASNCNKYVAETPWAFSNTCVILYLTFKRI